jgi:hypothetical protein
VSSFQKTSQDAKVFPEWGTLGTLERGGGEDYTTDIPTVKRGFCEQARMHHNDLAGFLSSPGNRNWGILS